MLIAALLLGRVWVDRSSATVLPYVSPRDVVLFDQTPLAITVTSFWAKVPRTVTTDSLLRDHPLWRQMHFGDWDLVPAGVRERALARMLAHYAPALGGPEAWAAMTIHDWDAVPHPVRAMAYQRMIDHWTSYYDVGAGYAPSRGVVVRTVAAIVMAESWFEHRAVNVNPWGNRDLGLAQCSDHCRAVLEGMAAAGQVDFLLTEHEYFDPYNGTRVAAVWFGRELQRAGGDVDLAIAAYHRGLDAAHDDRGRAYLANVQQLRRRFIDGRNAPPAWAFLQRQTMAARAATATD